MDKYLHKFLNFYELHDMNLNDNTIKNVFELFYKHIHKAHNRSHDIKIIETQKIKKLHSKNEYPLLYKYVKMLQDNGKINEVINNCPVFNIFKQFVEWQRINATDINFNLIKNNIPDIDTGIDKYSECQKLLYSKIRNNQFISLDIQQDIESSDISYSKIIINNRHTIHSYIFDDNDKPNYKYVATIIDFMEHIAKHYNQPTPPVDLVIIYTKQKKLIKKNTKILCADNINSGSTYPGKTITCWRKEEFYKVLIHELFHYYKFDFHCNEPSYDRLYNNIDVGTIDGVDSINECYTEANTIILHCLYKSILEDTNYESVLNNFKKYIMIEMNFMIFQVAKIINLFNGNSLDDLFNNRIVLRQNTNVRSYFIIKFLLLLNFDKFFEFINKDLVVNDNRLMEFGKLINISKQNLLSTNDIINKINGTINKLHHSSNNNWITKTSKMTIITIH